VGDESDEISFRLQQFVLEVELAPDVPVVNGKDDGQKRHDKNGDDGPPQRIVRRVGFYKLIFHVEFEGEAE
jgi:hypothetical protein